MIEQLRARLLVARVGDDAEGVHQVRVAARRLDAWLVLGNRRMLRDDLRWLRATVSRARDLDVLIGGEVPGWLLSQDLLVWLQLRRAEEQPKIVAALESERSGALLDALSLLPDIDQDTARRSISPIVRQVLDRAAQLRANDDPDDDDLHGLRRAVRRLRFALEWMGEKSSALAELQQIFGEFNNRVLLLRWLDAFPEQSVTEEPRARLGAELCEQRATVVRTWQGVQDRVQEVCLEWT